MGGNVVQRNGDAAGFQEFNEGSSDGFYTTGIATSSSPLWNAPQMLPSKRVLHPFSLGGVD